MLGNIFILGDSYSTFEEYIPEDYSCYYRNSGPYYLIKYPEMEKTDNDVCKVDQTWWYDIVQEKGTLVRNCSYSGTTVCNTGYDGADESHRSFIARFDKLANEGFFEKNDIDTVFLFGGTNDSGANAPLGEEIYENWTEKDLYSVIPAFSYLVKRIKDTVPKARVYCILNTELKSEITEGYKKICAKYDISVIELSDIEKVCDHPTIKGMAQIKEQVIKSL